MAKGIKGNYIFQNVLMIMTSSFWIACISVEAKKDGLLFWKQKTEMTSVGPDKMHIVTTGFCCIAEQICKLWKQHKSKKKN